MKILIVHPEGNTHNNPNLTGICQILIEKEHRVSVALPQVHRLGSKNNRSLSQVRFIEYGKLKNRIIRSVINRLQSLAVLEIIVRLFLNSFVKDDYDLIIGVDREGLAIASVINKLKQVDFGMISYEIMFAEENKVNFKNIEISSSEKIDFAICQDEERSLLLSKENKIPIKKIFNIPVAGRTVDSSLLSLSGRDCLREKLGIEKNKKIAFYAGSIAEWTMIPELIRNMGFFPRDWVLVLHDRYGDTKKKLMGICKIKHFPENLYFSNDPVSTNDEMHLLLSSVDLGIVFYEPIYSNPFTGLNLKHLGLASGKASTYLQHGVPMLCNEIGMLSRLVKEHNLGFVVKDFCEFTDCLAGYSKTDYHDRCVKFFNEKLSVDSNISPFLTYLERKFSADFVD